MICLKYGGVTSIKRWTSEIGRLINIRCYRVVKLGAINGDQRKNYAAGLLYSFIRTFGILGKATS